MNLNLPYRWCFFHNEIECEHDPKTDTEPPAHCLGIDESEDYSKCDVRDAVVSPKEE